MRAALLLVFLISSPRGEKPNLIFILADDLGYGDLGCYGQKEIRTPHIDRLAAEGLRFTHVYAGATVCAPSRCVLMTGLHTGHARVRSNNAQAGGVGPQKRVPLEPEDLTVAEVLKAAGYATGITGKWGLGEPETTGVPTRQGFDEWFGYLNQQHAHSYYPEYLWRNEEKVELKENLGGKRGRYSHDLFAEFALDFVRRKKDGPFFLYLAWTLPHQKYEIPSVEPYQDKPWDPDAKVHAAMITRMDRDVGRLMALLRELGLDEKTIVFFTSDNGAARRWDGVFDSTAGLRANKGSVYEGGIRTPMIVRWPGKVPAGRTSDAVWTFADFLPTAAELAGARPPEKIDGASAVRSILGGKDDAERFHYWEAPGQGYRQAARKGRWKAVRPGVRKPVELYDLAADPREERNLAGAQPEILKSFEDYLSAARTDSPYWPFPR